MIKIAIFDLDGTLVDSLTDLALCVNKGLKKAGLEEKPVVNYKHYVGNGRDNLIRRAMGEHCNNEELFNIVMDTFNNEYAIHCNDNTSSYDGCDTMLKNLSNKGIQTAVLSNKPDEFVGDILKKIYPQHTFVEAWGQKPEYKCKPDGEALLAILEKHKIDKSECVYIGDSDVDVFTAKNAGVKMLGVEWGFRGREELMQAGASDVAKTADELFKLICDCDE